MNDKINNYYNILNINKNKNRPKNWNNHHIEHNSHILCIGQTGTGKTNALIDYLMRSNNEFNKIVVFTGSTTDEPLYQELKNSDANIEFYTDINEMPKLEDLECKGMQNQPKLIVFDDWINLPEKELKEIYKYIVSSRKYGCSCFIMAQSYTSVPKIILRNVNYIILFKINDNVSIRNIIRNHNLNDIDIDLFKKAYHLSTDKPFSFMLLDFKSTDDKDRIRNNFLNFLDLKKKKIN